MTRADPVMGNYLEASATMEFVLSLSEGTDFSVRLNRYRPLIMLPMCHVAAVCLLDNRFRRSKPASQWNEFATAVTYLNEELEKGRYLASLSDPLGNPRQVRKEAEELAAKYHLDIIDAMQLQRLRKALDADPLGTLLTVSDGFEQAATCEGLRVWNCLRAPEP